MKTKAYLYSRFSTADQSGGRSFERQTDVESFIKSHNLQIVETMTDAGISAYRGKNFRKSLGKFVEAVKAGKIEKGGVLIIEDMDRFSRQQLADTQDRFSELTKLGIGLGIVEKNVIIDRAKYQEKEWNNYVSDEAYRANKESKRKAGFAKDNLSAKVAKAKHGEIWYFGSLSPAWLSALSFDGRRLQQGIKALPDKVKIIKRVAFLRCCGSQGLLE